MSLQGHLSLVLHAHLPYVRHPDHADFLEEDWLYEAIAECYIPLLRMMDRLADERVPFRLAMTLSPSLCAMLEDPLLLERASARLGRLVELAERLELDLRATPFAEAAAAQARELREVWFLYEERYRRLLLPAFRAHQEAGSLEILGCAATHAVLPLLATDAGRRAQVRVAQRSHARHFGQPAAGFWLPECAYQAPLDAHLEAVRWFVVETHGLTRAHPPARYGTARPAITPRGVAVFGRDPSSSEVVWSARAGYPGHPAYREFYRDAGFDLPYEEVRPYLHADGVRRSLGLKLHRVTGAVPLSEKAHYEPALALAQASAHAEDFVAGRLAEVERIRGQLQVTPHLLAPYDAELFGHWWAEGPAFLEQVLRLLARQDAIQALNPSEYLAENPVHQELTPEMSSWGQGGYFEVWLNPKCDWIWRHLHRAEERMIALSSQLSGRGGALGRALAQAGRELLLAQSSDWPFILTMQTSPAYAERRLREHLHRFHEIALPLEQGRVDLEAVQRAEHQDPLFPELDGSEWLPPERWGGGLGGAP